MTATTISTAHILTAGKATFTLEGKGRRFTYRIECVENPDRGSIYFAKLLKGPSNEHDYVYIGVYDPVNGWIHLTKKSQFGDNTECVRALRWYVSLVWSGRETEIEQHGFRVHWSNECQRCGKTLTVPSSIDARLGPECIKKV